MAYEEARECFYIMRDQLEVVFPQATLVALLEHVGMRPHIVAPMLDNGIIRPTYDEKQPPQYSLNDVQRAYAALRIKDSGEFKMWRDVSRLMINVIKRPEWESFFEDPIIAESILNSYFGLMTMINEPGQEYNY